MKQQLTWRQTWKIYWYHYLQTCLFGGLFLLALYILAVVLSYLFTFDLGSYVKKPVVIVLLAIVFTFIQLFPINLFVLKYRTFRKNFDGYRLQFKADTQDDS